MTAAQPPERDVVNDPAMPSDTSLAAVVDALTAEGYAGQFRAEEDGAIHCFTCRRAFPAGEADLAEGRRLEGVSDPADMLYVVPLRCPRCAAHGTLVLNYGPESTSEEVDVLAALERTHRSRRPTDGHPRRPCRGGGGETPRSFPP